MSVCMFDHFKYLVGFDKAWCCLRPVFRVDISAVICYMWTSNHTLSSSSKTCHTKKSVLLTLQAVNFIFSRCQEMQYHKESNLGFAWW